VLVLRPLSILAVEGGNGGSVPCNSACNSLLCSEDLRIPLAIAVLIASTQRRHSLSSVDIKLHSCPLNQTKSKPYPDTADEKDHSFAYFTPRRDIVVPAAGLSLPTSAMVKLADPGSTVTCRFSHDSLPSASVNCCFKIPSTVICSSVIPVVQEINRRAKFESCLTRTDQNRIICPRFALICTVPDAVAARFVGNVRRLPVLDKRGL
jgi:hypothetical protein